MTMNRLVLIGPGPAVHRCATFSKKFNHRSTMVRCSQASSSAVLRTAAVLLCVMLITVDSFAAATSVDVGGRAGWTIQHNYGHLSVRRGDALAFNYNKKFHNVLQVRAGDYSKCLVPSRPIKEYSSGRDIVRLNNPGTYYFICGIPGHCSSGMKVSVTVH